MLFSTKYLLISCLTISSWARSAGGWRTAYICSWAGVVAEHYYLSGHKRISFKYEVTTVNSDSRLDTWKHRQSEAVWTNGINQNEGIFNWTLPAMLYAIFIKISPNMVHIWLFCVCMLYPYQTDMRGILGLIYMYLRVTLLACCSLT